MEPFNVSAFDVYNKEWALVTAGTEDHFNSMTISWGGLGTLWRKPAVTVYVKPVRYTHQFMDENDLFTVSFYSEDYRKALDIMGTKSGRDCDKVKEAGLTPLAVQGTMTFREAKVTLICRKMYRQDLDRRFMDDETVRMFYVKEEPHTMYIGEVLEILKGE